MNLLNVRDFYKNKSILLTGSTGFLGKVLIEKLLHSCYDVEKIYLLVRRKKGFESHERLEEIFKNEKVA
jgi:fatty acyl-CoA reductase